MITSFCRSITMSKAIILLDYLRPTCVLSFYKWNFEYSFLWWLREVDFSCKLNMIFLQILILLSKFCTAFQKFQFFSNVKVRCSYSLSLILWYEIWKAIRLLILRKARCLWNSWFILERIIWYFLLSNLYTCFSGNRFWFWWKDW
jgi:hypothetical protein